MRSRFSRRGEPTTEAERHLLKTSAADDAWVAIGQRIGADALAVVMDELGTLNVRVPSRCEFFAKLWRPERDAQIRAHHRVGISVDDIAQRFGMSRPNVLRIVAAVSPADAPDSE